MSGLVFDGVCGDGGDAAVEERRKAWHRCADDTRRAWRASSRGSAVLTAATASFEDVKDVMLFHTDMASCIEATVDETLKASSKLPARIAGLARELAARGLMSPSEYAPLLPTSSPVPEELEELKDLKSAKLDVAESLLLVQTMRKIYRPFVEKVAAELCERGVRSITSSNLVGKSPALALNINAEISRLAGLHPKKYFVDTDETKPTHSVPSVCTRTPRRGNGSGSAQVRTANVMNLVSGMKRPLPLPLETPEKNSHGGDDDASRSKAKMLKMDTRECEAPASAPVSAPASTRHSAPPRKPGISTRRITMNFDEPLVPAHIVCNEPFRDADGDIVCPRWVPVSLLRDAADPEKFDARPYGTVDEFVITGVNKVWFTPMAAPTAVPTSVPTVDPVALAPPSPPRPPSPLPPPPLPSPLPPPPRRSTFSDNPFFSGTAGGSPMNLDIGVTPSSPRRYTSDTNYGNGYADVFRDDDGTTREDHFPSNRGGNAQDDAQDQDGDDTQDDGDEPQSHIHWMASVEEKIWRLEDYQFVRTPDKALIVFFIKTSKGAHEFIRKDSILLFNVSAVHGPPLVLPPEVAARTYTVGLADGTTLWGIRGIDLATVVNLWTARRVAFKSASPLLYKKYEVNYATECRGPPVTYPDGCDAVSRDAPKFILTERARFIFDKIRSDLTEKEQWAQFSTCADEICALVGFMPPKINFALAEVIAKELDSTVSRADVMEAMRFERSISIDISDAQREQLLWVMFQYETVGKKSRTLYLYMLDLLLYFGWHVAVTPYKQNYYGWQTVARQTCKDAINAMRAAHG